ncbi:hypothetical protein D4L71_RS27190, partial [Escherichia coli]
LLWRQAYLYLDSVSFRHYDLQKTYEVIKAKRGHYVKQGNGPLREPSPNKIFFHPCVVNH